MKALLLLCALLLAARAHADEEIQPFGGFNWDDDVLDVIVKMNKIDGIKNVTLEMRRWEESFTGVKTREAAAAKLDALVRKAMLGTNPVARARDFDENFEKYKTKDGKTMRCIGEVTVYGSSVVVAGVLYDVTATLKTHPGLQLTRPKNIFVVKGTEVAEPLVLEGVNLNQDKANTGNTVNVLKALDAKYHFAENQTAKSSSVGSVRWNSGIVSYGRSTTAIDKAYNDMIGSAATQGKKDTSESF